MPQAAGKYYYLADGLGSIVDLTEETEAVVESYEYDSFGKITIKDAAGSTLQASGVGNFYTYTSREYDSETGLYFYRARYYDPTIGRFISADPIGFNGGGNFYGYVGGNPILLIDPFGKASMCIALVLPSLTIPGWVICVFVGIVIIEGVIFFKVWARSNEANDDDANERERNHEHCVRLYELCKTQEWVGNCAICLSHCEVQRVWPLYMCHPCKRR